ncbi:MAG: biopolymer transporter ExbD [Puniceicoccales bacterium]|nr:biopolymer transporter ExbD [Puniceicoccales bacterium]
MSLYRPRRRRAEINIVPLIDVMTVLIFFFLLTMRFDEMRSLAITPPSSESADVAFSAGTGRTVISVTKTGSIYLNGKAITREALEIHFAEVGKKYPKSRIFVVTDEKTMMKDGVYVVDRANKAGLLPSLVTRRTRG